ncbi:hypothetical protein SDC9_56275 [bioreactor metagenome]|uniref:Uncharacterized protein n=1 Tax=bioreactor metagenome TaxID=1076179 RepID=A0A644X236_9ZZZZ
MGYRCGVDDACKTGDTATDKHGKNYVSFDRDTLALGCSSILSNHIELKAPTGLVQDEPENDHQYQSEIDAAVHSSPDSGKPSKFRVSDSAHIPSGGFPSIDVQIFGIPDDDIVHHQGGERLVNAPLCFQGSGNTSPECTAEHSNEHTDGEQQHIREKRPELHDPGDADDPCNILALSPDVPEFEAEGYPDGQAAKQKWDSLGNRILNLGLASECSLEHCSVGLQRIYVGDSQDNGSQ